MAENEITQTLSMHSKAYLYLLLTFFLWGSLYVVSKFVLGKLPAFTLAFVRFLLAFATLLGILFLSEALSIRFLAGAVLIVCGVLISLLNPGDRFPDTV